MFSESLNYKSKKIKTTGHGGIGNEYTIDKIDIFEEMIKEMHEKKKILKE